MTGAETITTPSFDRVRARTSSRVNARLDDELQGRLLDLESQGPEAMRARIEQIDREWDIDRMLIAMFPIVGGITHELGHRVHRAFSYLFRVQLGFMLSHAIVGWCPPVPVLRRLGFRTRQELDDEKHTLEGMLARTTH